MRITFLLSSLRLSGGVWYILKLARQLAQRGHHVSLVVPGKTTDPDLRLHIPSTVKIFESPVPLLYPSSRKLLFKLVWSMAMITPLSEVLIATHTPTVVPTLLASIVLQKGKATWIHMDYEEQFEGRFLERWLLFNAPRWFRVIFTLSEPQAVLVRKQTKAKVVIVGSGLRSPLFYQLPPRKYKLQEPFRVFYLGDARPRKGFWDALAAVELVAKSINIEFIVASKMPISFATDVPCIVYIKPTDEELIHLYKTSDIFVFSSWREGLGYPPLEAMACGTPVVLTNSWGVLDYARHEENCLLVPPREPTKLAEAIKRLLTDRQLYMRLAQNGPPTARRYTWETAIERLEEGLKLLNS